MNEQQQTSKNNGRTLYLSGVVNETVAGYMGSVPDIEVGVEEIQKSRDILVKHISSRSNLSPEEIKQLIQRNAYLDALQAIEMGFADAVITKIK